MFDIFTAILEELLGTKEKKAEAQPRRRVRGDGQPSQSAAPRAPTQGTPTRKPTSPLEEMVRQLFGGAEMEEVEKAEEAPPPPPPPPPPKPRRETRAIQTPAAEPAALDGTFKITELQSALTIPPGLEPDAESGSESGRLPEFVARLRGNRAAAREAFVYSEIFGPPLADR